MPRSADDWRESGRETILEKTEGVDEEINSAIPQVQTIVSNIRVLANKDEPDRDDTEEIRNAIGELSQILIELAHTSLDQANEVQKIVSEGTLRTLLGEEPLNYSTPDGGARHDAYYGAQAQSRIISREVFWPLRLHSDKWDKEEAGRQRNGPVPDIEPVSAEGTTKYTRKIGGRTVHVVIDNREYSPI